MNAWQSPRSSPRIALLTPYDGGNLGDATIQEALIVNFRRQNPQVQLCGITLHPERTSLQHGIPCYPLAVTSRPCYATVRGGSERGNSDGRPFLGNVFRFLRHKARRIMPLRWLKSIFDEALHVLRSYRVLSNVDLLVVAGGGQLDEEWGGSWGHPYALLKWSVLARAAGASVVFMSVGACQLRSRVTRLFIKIALELACYRSYRDRGSRDLALALTDKATGAVVPDIAFSFPITSQDVVPQSVERGLCVAISPIAYGCPGLWPTENAALHHYYVAQLATFVSTIVKNGASVVLFSSSAPDEQVFRELTTQLSVSLDEQCRRRLYTSNTTSLWELLDLIHRVDYVVASRLHGVLISFLAEKPSIAISYDRKVTSLMKDLDQMEYCLDIHSLTSHALLERFLALQNNGASTVKKLRDIRSLYNRCLQAQYREVMHFAVGFSPVATERKDKTPSERVNEQSPDIVRVGNDGTYEVCEELRETRK